MRILVAEDDPAQAEALCTVLVSEFRVEWARDGEQAWQMHRNTPYDLLLVDVQLPELDGISLCRRLRKSTDSTPILLLTADTSVDSKVAGLSNGADDYICKPVLTAELLARIRNLLRRGRVKTQNILSNGPLRIDYLAHTVTYADQNLDLTPKEYALLELLLSQPDRLFSSAKLVELLWPHDVEITENTVKSHIKGIRQKLRKVNAANLILNVRGLGYKLSENLLRNSTMSSSVSLLEPQMNALWETYRPLMLERLSDIVRCIDALRSGVITEDLIQNTRRSAHNLVGSLGLFGRGGATSSVRRIEEILSGEFEMIDIVDLESGLGELRRVLGDTVFTHLSQDSDTVRNIEITVLAVDDDAAFLSGVEYLLNRDGMNVVTLQNHENILSVLAEQNPDLLLLDLNFPGRSGIEICEMLRQDPRWKQLPIIFVTAIRDPHIIEKIFESLADDYIGKPLRPDEFSARVASRLMRIRSIKQ